MAAIEKICEFSGEYPSWLMYGYKRNHIQIMPKYRKKFHGADAVLHIFKGEEQLVKFKSGKIDRIQSYSPSSMLNYEPPFANEKEYLDYLKEMNGYHLKARCWYALEVKDEGLQGDVEGLYAESTHRPICVVRRMKRLVRNSKLKVIKHDCTFQQWQSDRENI